MKDEFIEQLGEALERAIGSVSALKDSDAPIAKLYQAANSRPALSAMLEENKRLREALERINEYLQSHGIELHRTNSIVKAHKQALEGSE